jgi:hypothetical protein
LRVRVPISEHVCGFLRWWNFDGMIEDAQLGLFCGWLIAQADQMQSWNPGDEFEAARKSALGEVSK